MLMKRAPTRTLSMKMVSTMMMSTMMNFFYELDEAAAWFHEVSIAFNETPDDPEVYASFQEARRAFDKARVSPV